MQLHFFSIPVLQPEPASTELNHLLASQRVAHVDKQFVAQGAQSCWAVCVTTVGATAPAAGVVQAGSRSSPDRATRRAVVDYREVLSPDEFALYDRLRQVRKAAAEADGLPTTAVLTNFRPCTLAQGLTKRCGPGAVVAPAQGAWANPCRGFLPFNQPFAA